MMAAVLSLSKYWLHIRAVKAHYCTVHAVCKLFNHDAIVFYLLFCLVYFKSLSDTSPDEKEKLN